MKKTVKLPRRILNEAGIYEKYHLSKLSDYLGPDTVTNAIRSVISKITCTDSPSILLIGDSSTGKTMLACIVAKCALAKNKTAKVVSVENLVAAYKKTFEGDSFNYEYFKSVNILVLDSVEYMYSNELVKQSLYHVLRYREQRNYTTLITSQKPITGIDSLEDLLGRRIIDIFEHGYIVLECPKVPGWKRKNAKRNMRKLDV